MNLNLRSNVIVLSLIATGITALVGCSGIRVVRASPQGGEIALQGNREDAMEKARAEMARTCGGPQNYQIVEEGETVVGEQTSGNSTTQQGQTWTGRPASRTTTNQTTRDVTEWRVKYACGGAAPPPAGPHPGAAPPPGGAPPPAPMPVGQIHELVIRY
ncbi:hypothetical protein BH09MYX1_BH09MYX1_60420 [soil metagenome]